MSKQHSLSMEQLLHDVIERIMEMLPVKSLLRFKAVSKQWQSTIESRFFQENQLRQREKSRDPDVLMVGFGKDKLTGIYKPVWLYINVGRDATICEVFDFSTNTWRYTTASAPYWISYYHDPVYVDGLLHWFTQCKETKVMSLDLHTETFQVIYKVPFTDVDPYHMIMCNLDDRLCISQKKKSKQVIWLFSSGNKTWDKMCSIDLELTSFQFGISMSIPFLPLALLERKKLLIFPRYFGTTLVIHDLETKSYDAAFSDAFIGYPVCYFQSLISIL
ncbi:hypothetical protein Bca52824_013097 [Brassica carinata]|uniref:F-box domain-containing protein n=1 Tax=Brassica carinata TaxID=52824 RepID=A0A8X8B0Z3_BRACI|nr:hypothetical protein Bca52824_013097 [Brassica carinata]